MWLLENFKLRVWLAFSLHYNTAVYSTTKKEVWRTETLIKAHPSIQFRLWECYRKTNSVSSTNEWFKGKKKDSNRPREMESEEQRKQEDGEQTLGSSQRSDGRKGEVSGELPWRWFGRYHSSVWWAWIILTRQISYQLLFCQASQFKGPCKSFVLIRFI